MDIHILLHPNSFIHQSGKVYFQEFYSGGASSLFGTQQQCGWAAFLAVSASVQS